MTLDEYAIRPDDERTEFADGYSIDLPAETFEHNFVRDGVVGDMRSYLRRSQIGYVASECEFVTRPGRSRRADACFFRADRFLPEFRRMSVIPVAPDLVIEVISTHDTARGVRARVREYLEAGVETVWVLYPEKQQAEICDRTRDRKRVAALTADCLPGYQLNVRELFASQA